MFATAHVVMIPCIWYPSISHLITAPEPPGRTSPITLRRISSFQRRRCFFATVLRLQNDSPRRLSGGLYANCVVATIWSEVLPSAWLQGAHCRLFLRSLPHTR